VEVSEEGTRKVNNLQEGTKKGVENRNILRKSPIRVLGKMTKRGDFGRTKVGLTQSSLASIKGRSRKGALGKDCKVS